MQWTMSLALLEQVGQLPEVHYTFHTCWVVSEAEYTFVKLDPDSIQTTSAKMVAVAEH